MNNALIQNKDWSIVVQARTGASRLPGKMIQSFFKDQTLVEVVLNNLVHNIPKEKIILAAPSNPKDDQLCKIVSGLGISVFRGSEDNVLKRFIDASEAFNIKYLVRVCADNPFINPEFISNLIDKGVEKKADYISWFFSDDLPVIRSHSGIFAEWVSLDALKKIAALSNDKMALEHVTYFIYQNQDLFSIIKLPVENENLYRKIRLTIDTEDDFILAKKIFHELSECWGYSQDNLIHFLEKNPVLVDQMEKNIKINAK